MFNSFERGHAFSGVERKFEISRDEQAKNLWKKLVLQVHPHFCYGAEAQNEDWQSEAEKITSRLSEIYRNKKNNLGIELEDLQQLENLIAERKCTLGLDRKLNESEGAPNNRKESAKERLRKSLEQELVLLEGDHYNYEGLRMLDGELFPADMRDSDVLETVEKRIAELKEMLAKLDSGKSIDKVSTNKNEEVEEVSTEISADDIDETRDVSDNRIAPASSNKYQELAQGVYVDKKVVDGEAKQEKKTNTWEDFLANVKSIKLKNELIEYLNSLEGKKNGGRKLVAQIYIENIKKVFNADLPVEKLKPDFLCEAVKEIRRIELARIGTEFTLGKIGSYVELQAETEKEGDEILKNKARELWNFFAVHKKGSGKFGETNTDLDGKCSLGLFKLAKVKFNFKTGVKYVDPGKSEPGAISLDTGSRHGASIRKEDGRDDGLIIDHHGEMTGNQTSGTQESYEFLVAMGLLKRTEQLGALVDFVTKIDNLTYPGVEKYFENSHQTLAGLERFVQFDALKKFFDKKRNQDDLYDRQLTEREKRDLGLIYFDKKKNKEMDRSEEQKKAIENSKIGLQELESDGLIIDSERYGKIVIDIGKKVPGGFMAAKAYDCGAYIIWSPEKKSFFISTSESIEDEFSQGFKIRQKMWMKPVTDTSELTISLKEIIEKMTDNKIAADKLANIIKSEKRVLVKSPKVTAK